MKYFTVIALFLLSACATTPNTEEQLIAAFDRQEHREWKAWCLEHNGIVYEDDFYGRKCFSSGDFRHQLQRESFA